MRKLRAFLLLLIAASASAQVRFRVGPEQRARDGALGDIVANSSVAATNGRDFLVLGDTGGAMSFSLFAHDGTNRTPKGRPLPVAHEVYTPTAAASDGLNYLAGFEQFPSGTVAVAQISSDGVAGAINTLGAGKKLRLAWDGAIYLAAWIATDGNPRALILDKSGTPVGKPFDLDVRGGATELSIASNGDNFVVAWTAGNALYTAAITHFGLPLRPALLVDASASIIRDSLQFDGREYVVVMRNGDSVRVRPLDPLGGFDPFVTGIDLGNTKELRTATADGNSVIAVWDQDVATVASVVDIRGGATAPADLGAPIRVQNATDVSSACADDVCIVTNTTHVWFYGRDLTLRSSRHGDPVAVGRMTQWTRGMTAAHYTQLLTWDELPGIESYWGRVSNGRRLDGRGISMGSGFSSVTTDGERFFIAWGEEHPVYYDFLIDLYVRIVPLNGEPGPPIFIKSYVPTQYWGITAAWTGTKFAAFWAERDGAIHFVDVSTDGIAGTVRALPNGGAKEDVPSATRTAQGVMLASLRDGGACRYGYDMVTLNRDLAVARTASINDNCASRPFPPAVVSTGYGRTLLFTSSKPLLLDDDANVLETVAGYVNSAVVTVGPLFVFVRQENDGNVTDRPWLPGTRVDAQPAVTLWNGVTSIGFTGGSSPTGSAIAYDRSAADPEGGTQLMFVRSIALDEPPHPRPAKP